MRDVYGLSAAEILTSLSAGFWHFVIGWPFTTQVISHLFVFKILDFNVLSLCSSGEQDHTTAPPLCLLSIDYVHCPPTDGHNFLIQWESNKVKEEEGKDTVVAVELL